MRTRRCSLFLLLVGVGLCGESVALAQAAPRTGSAPSTPPAATATPPTTPPATPPASPPAARTATAPANAAANGSAPARTAGATQPTNQQVNFDHPENVRGEVQAPTGATTTARRRPTGTSLIRLRQDFRRETERATESRPQ